MSEKILNVALVGYGYWGPNLLRNLVAHPGINVAWVCDLSEANLSKAKANFPSLKTTTKIEDILSSADIAAVVLAVPTKAHFELIKKSVLANKSVLVEKPFTYTVKQALKISALVNKHKAKVFVDHPYVFSEPVKFIKDYIDKGKLGKIYYLESSRMNMGLIQPDIGVIEDLAPHDISILDFLLGGEEPISVSSMGSRHVGKKQIEHAHISYSFANNISAHIRLSWLSPLKTRRIIIGGSKKMIVFDDTLADQKIKIFDKGVSLNHDEYSPFKPLLTIIENLLPQYLANFSSNASIWGPFTTISL